MGASVIDYIKKEIQRTGFPLEDKIASIFSKLGNFDVDPSYNFTDWQTEELRELDLRITYEVTPYPIKIEYVFLVECKCLPDHAWVFISNERNRLLFKNARSAWDHVGKIGRQDPAVDILEPLFAMDNTVCDTYANRFKEIILKEKKSNKRDDNILSSAIKLAKVLYFEEKSWKESDNFLREKRSRDADRIIIYYPLIVFEGEMFEAKMLPNLEVKPISSAHLHYFSLQKGEGSDIIIDVVKIENLEEFIRKKFFAEAEQIKKNEATVRKTYLNLIKKLKQTGSY